jgi:hypothetical protein
MTTTFPSMLLLMSGSFLDVTSGLVLLVADLFHPVNRFAVELLLNGDLRHGSGCCGAVAVLLTRLEPDHVTRPNFLDRAAPALHQPAAGRHDQGLAQRVGVPRCPSAGLEPDTGAERAGRGICRKQRVNAHGPVKYSAGPLPEGCEPLLLMSII